MNQTQLNDLTKMHLCPLCMKQSAFDYVRNLYAFRDSLYDLNRCSICRVVFVNPIPNFEIISEMYADDYFKKDYSLGNQHGSYLETASSRIAQYQEIFNLIQKHLGDPKGKRFLEIGCAGGAFLNYLKQKGVNVEGVDVSSWAVKAAEDNFGIFVHKGMFTEINLKADNYDCIYMGDVFEHLPDPTKNLSQAFLVLKSQGLLILEIPTYVNSVYYRTLFKIAPLMRKFMDPKLISALKIQDGKDDKLPPYHLFEYDRYSLQKLFDGTSFKIDSFYKKLWLPGFLGKEEVQRSRSLILKAERVVFLILRYLIENLGVLPAARAIVVARK